MTNNYKLLKTVAFVLLLTIASKTFAQIPNPGFENWYTAGTFPTYNEPTNWGTLNSATALVSIFTAEKATGAGNFHSGSSAIKLSTHFISFVNQTAPGIAVTGTINTSTQQINGGFPVNQRYLALTGWFKGTPAANDYNSIELTLWKWDNVNNVRVDVGTASFSSSTTVSSFTEFVVPINYLTSDVPDSALIILSSSNPLSPVAGSVFYVDDLAFSNCALFEATTSTTNATCTSTNGSATVTTSGGTNPVSVQWSTTSTNYTVFNLAAGTYSVTATDANSCTATASATVSANITPITVTTDSTQSSCISNTGSVTATTTDGAQPYTYLWSNDSTTSTVTNLGAGNYSVTITDSNGCTGEGTTSITTPNGPSAAAVVTNAACFNGSTGAIDLTVAGGTGSITYVWSNGVTTEDLNNIPPGTYCVTITDANGCEFTLCETVTEPPLLTFSTVANDATCFGVSDGSITGTITGGTPPYVWSDSSITSLSAGTYSFTITDANTCSATSSATVSEPTELTVLSTVTDATSATSNDGSIILNPSGGTTPYAVSWSSGNGTNLAPGVYSYTVTDANGCSTSGSDTVSAPTGIRNISEEKIALYPNPAFNEITIETNSPDGKFIFYVYDLTGRLVDEKNISGSKITVSVKNLDEGLYTYQLKNISSGNISYGKLQITR